MNPTNTAWACIRALATLAATMLGVGLTTAALAAAALLSACGGGGVAADADVQIAVLDADALGTIDAAAREAAAARGAPGEAEPVRYVVHANQVGRGEAVAAELRRLGFEPVHLIVAAHDGRSAEARSR